MKNNLFFLLLCILSFELTAHKIRALCVTGDQPRWDGLFEMAPLLKKNGLIFVNTNPDVILCNKVTDEVLQHNRPIIILEKSAAASVTRNTKSKLHLPQVKAVFKDRILREKTLNTIPAIRGRYFYNLINDYANIIHFDTAEQEKLSQEELNKIKLVIWDIWGGPYNQEKFPQLVNLQVDYTKNRPIDVFFAGKSKGNNFYKWHRSKALQTIDGLTNYKTIALDGKVLPFEEYIETMLSAKIVVSPWGLGEWCFRDFEAIHCGALLIKPDTSFVESYPDIYQNYTTYIPCKPDFSDLEEKVNYILKHYAKFKKIRKRAKQLVTTTWGLEHIASLFVENVRLALQEHKE